VIRDGDTVATSGFVGAGFAEEIPAKLEETFLATGRPRNLILVYAAGQGNGAEKGLNHMGHEGLIRSVIGGHLGLAPKLQKLVKENKILAYNPLQACPRDGVGGLWDSRAGREAGGTPNRHEKNSGIRIRNPLDALRFARLFSNLMPYAFPCSAFTFSRSIVPSWALGREETKVTYLGFL
jgi:hypothetical protein